MDKYISYDSELGEPNDRFRFKTIDVLYGTDKDPVESTDTLLRKQNEKELRTNVTALVFGCIAGLMLASFVAFVAFGAGVWQWV